MRLILFFPYTTRSLCLFSILTLSCVGAIAQEITICYDFGCKSHTNVIINDRVLNYLRHQFTPVAATAEAERQQISQVIAALETMIGKVTGTEHDQGRNYNPEHDYPGQMDCIDESTNTTTYLALLHQHGLLRWHTPQPRHYRSRFFIDGHWTAVIKDNQSGQHYAVDSWYWGNGEPPEIQPLQDWLKRKRPRNDSSRPENQPRPQPQ